MTDTLIFAKSSPTCINLDEMMIAKTVTSPSTTDKLIFTKPSMPRSRSDKYPTVRVKLPIYNWLTKISDMTGLSISSITNSMIEYAINHTEIVEPCLVKTSQTYCNNAFSD